MVKNNRFVQLWLIVGLVAGFALVLFMVISYLNSNVFCDLDCSQKNKAIVSIITLSLAGMFIGSLTYYFISEKYEKRIFSIKKDLNNTLMFLDSGPREIVKVLIKNNGEMSQSQLSRESELSKLQVSRFLKALEEKKIITKTRSGMTNSVTLCTELKKIYLDR